VSQGFAKKIEIELLLPDFLLQFPDPALGFGQCLFLRGRNVNCAPQMSLAERADVTSDYHEA
jgi:hypothetical protein